MKKWSDLLDDFSRLGNAIKAGTATKSQKAIYKSLAEVMRDQKTAIRHAEWQKCYNQTLIINEEKNLSDGMSASRARHQAHLSAQAAVAKKFNINPRQVRRSITTYKKPPLDS